MAFQDEREIDEWFEEKKRLLAEKLYDRLRGGDDKATRDFDKAFDRLLTRLQDEYRGLEIRRRRLETLARPFDWFRAWRKSLLFRFRRWRKTRSEQRKKRKFEREYKKLFKHG